MSFAAVEGGHYFIKRAATCVVFAVVVVEFFRAVDADSDEEIIFMEKIAPVVVDKNCVCLEGVADLPAFGCIFLLKLDGPFIEIKTHKSGFTPLPGKTSNGKMQLQVVFCHLFEDGVGHLLAALTDLGRAVLVEAVSAIEVAVRPRRFYQKRKRLHGMIIRIVRQLFYAF